MHIVNVFLLVALSLSVMTACAGGAAVTTTSGVGSSDSTTQPATTTTTVSQASAEPSGGAENDSSLPETQTNKSGTKNPLVTITMSDGKTMCAELYPDVAPNTVNSFISLIESGFYDGLIFHRVVPGFVIQGGDPDGTGMGGPGYSITGEFTNNGFKNDLLHTRGVLSMARSSHPDSAGSQFFIMVEDADFLDGEYAAFGKVISGIETADAIVSVDRDGRDKPNVDQTIKSVTVDTFGVDYEEPEVIPD